MGNDIVSWANNNANNDGRYSYTEKVGEGGFGYVLKVVDRSTDIIDVM